MELDEQLSDLGIDPSVPSVARMYDYYLGGKDNYASDREAADRVLAAMPYVLEFTRANREFLSRAVTMLAERGVRQFLDIGSGLPTRENTHQVAQRVAPDARVVYVDNDPIVLVHGRALLADGSRTTVLQADVLDPDAIMEHPEVRERFDFSEPIAVLMLAILHFVADDARPAEIVARLREPLAPGSHLVISHGFLGERDADKEGDVRDQYGRTGAGDIIPRTREELLGFFAGTEVLPPGLVPVSDWRPDAGFFEPDMSRTGFLGGVGRIH
ncbi:SAM-dependent methyltransferase [Actinomadura algeriensis]|uniref:O-methyltransferase involved in polyketide biosynthesis n=1 Tax=Actinomadura algeriensis TaxID=1679523 RepID=A0ABR9JYB7_9ACTN|nr:SAM-dependent methyltransferase [Actinomadura algeriensis]MBE1535579.1 O-methyltransferase involved in polyketide biosynthesis [Actinomadura algeriensis]